MHFICCSCAMVKHQRLNPVVWGAGGRIWVFQWTGQLEWGLPCKVFSPRITIPLEYWVVSTIFCRLQTILDVREGQCQGQAAPRPPALFGPPVMERERGGTKLKGKQGWGLLGIAIRAASLPCRWGFLGCVAWGFLLAFLAGKVGTQFYIVF